MMSLDEMLVYQMVSGTKCFKKKDVHVNMSFSLTISVLPLLSQELIPTSLLKLNTDNAARAVKMFATIQRYMGETGEALTQQQRLETIQKLLHQVTCPVWS